MTNKEIKQAAEEYQSRWEWTGDAYTAYRRGLHDGAGRGFADGIKYALDNLWTSVEDELPPYDEDVLAYDEHNGYHGLTARSQSEVLGRDKNDFAVDRYDLIREVSHWMRIPKPRKEVKDEHEEAE